MRTKLSILPAALPIWISSIGVAWADLAQRDGAGGYRYHPHMWGDGAWGGMFMGPLFGLLFIAVVAVAIVFVVRAVSGTGHHHRRAGGRTALDILDERFARGEIDVQEYEERKRTLTGG